MSRRSLAILVLAFTVLSVVAWLRLRPRAQPTAHAEVNMITTQTAPVVANASSSAKVAPEDPPASPFAHRERVRELADSTDPRVRALAKELVASQDRYDELATAYDDAHRLYVQRSMANAPAGELETFQRRLDELRDEMQEQSSAIHRATSQLNAAYVTERLAALGIHPENAR